MLLFKTFMTHHGAFPAARKGRHLILSLCCLFFLAHEAMAAEMRPTVGILLTDPHGRILHEQNPDTPFIPASTLKVLTALTALECLGPDFHFKTEIFLDQQQNIRIKGWGDPLFTSREIREVAMALGKRLKEKQIDQLHGLVMDDSAFDKEISIPGITTTLNPYDAPVGALCANFNTIAFKTRNLKPGSRKSRPTAQNTNDQAIYNWISAEPETPLIPFARKIIARSGSHMTEGRIPLPVGAETRYTGELLKWFLEKEGIKISKGVTRGQATPKDRLILTWYSPCDLQQVVEKLLCFSNNFVANQLFLTLGLKAAGPPATLAKGVSVVMAHAAALGVDTLFLEEGSGISRQNRLSPRDMLKLLRAFKPHHTLMKHTGREYYKTGTLQGVRTRCGYFQGRKNRLYPFVIMINQEDRSYENIKKKLQAEAAAWDDRHY